MYFLPLISRNKINIFLWSIFFNDNLLHFSNLYKSYLERYVALRVNEE